MALATCAKEFDYVQPQLVEENIISVKAGRHPLQELCCNVFVPNDINMGGGSSKMKLITGPNACGKSVYLKQVALIIYMAHIGSFVPAEEAHIGPCDGIFTRLKSIESVALNMSTFMQDLSQVSQAVSTASASSLIILDEFGKGTESTDGLSLLTAVMKFWMGKCSDCPLALISTHFHNIIHQRLLPNASNIEFLTLDTLANEEELVYLYQLMPGHASSSYACKCAVQVGIPSQVTQRGKQVSDLLCQYKTVPLEDTESVLKRRQMHERIVDKFLDLNLGVDDVKSFLKDFVLKQCEDQDTEESRSIQKDDHKHAEKSAKAAVLSTHLKNANKYAKSNNNEDIIALNTKGIVHDDFKKQNRDATKSLIDKSAISSVLTSAKECDTTKSGEFSKTDLRRYDSSVLHSNNEVQKAGKGDLPLIRPSNKDISSGNSWGRLNSENDSLNRNEGKNSNQLSNNNRQNVRNNNPLFATPNNLTLMNETYHKSQNWGSSSFAIRKRKGDILELTHSQIKHENLFNLPTPCLNYPDKSVSAPSANMSSALYSRQDTMTTTTDTDSSNIKRKYTEMLLDRTNPKPQLSPVYTSDEFNDKTKSSSSSAPLSKMSVTVSSRQYSPFTPFTDVPEAKQKKTEKVFNLINPNKPQLSPVYTSDELKNVPSPTNCLKFSSAPFTVKQDSIPTTYTEVPEVKQKHGEMNLNQTNPKLQMSPVYTSDDSNDNAKNANLSAPFKMSSTVCSKQYTTTTTDSDAPQEKDKGNNQMNRKSEIYADLDDKARNVRPATTNFGYPIVNSASRTSDSSSKISSTSIVDSKSKLDVNTTIETDELGEKARHYENVHQTKKVPLFSDMKKYSKPSWKVTSGESDTSSKSGDDSKNPSSVSVAVPSAMIGRHLLKLEGSSTDYPSTSC